MNRKGFTLIELAIVLIIIGIISAGGIKILSGALGSGKVSSTKTQVQSAVKNIAEYSARGMRIPSDSEFSSVVTPFRDSFGSDLLYVQSDQLTATGSICSASFTDLRIITAEGTLTNIAFFISSSSFNKAEDITVNGNDITLNETSDENDDITGWLTLDALKTFAGCEGSGMEIIQDRLAAGYIQSSYGFTLNAKGGTGAGTYTWCAESPNTDTRAEMRYQTTSLMDSGECTDGTNDVTDFKTADELSLNSASWLTDSFPSSSIVRVYLRDSSGHTVHKEYSLRVFKEYELVLDSNFTPDDPDTPITELPDFGDIITANIDAGDEGQVGTDYNSTMVTNVSPDNIEISSTGKNNGSACVWYSGKGGLAFAERYIVSYYEFESNTSNLFEGYTYALIKNIRPPKDDDGTAPESEYVSSEDDCGDSGSGMGYSYTDESDNLSNKLYGNGFAVEFDPRTSNDKNDPAGGGANNDHFAIVSALNGYAYNVHGSGQNDSCLPYSNSGGCYKTTDTYSGRKSVRVEAYHGYDPDGTYSGTSLDFICVYVWFSNVPAANSEMRNTDTGYMLQSGSIPFGDPAIYDCYDIDAGSLDNVRPGFTFSNLGTGTVLDFYNFEFKSLAY